MNKTIAKALRIFFYSLGGLVLILVLLVFSLKIPVVQQFVVEKAASYLSEKTGRNLAIGKFYVDFPDRIELEGLFAEDINHDTLVSLTRLSVAVDMLALAGGQISVDSIGIEGLTTNVLRGETDTVFNFDPFVRAFTGGGNPAAEEEDTAQSTFRLSLKHIHLRNIRALYNDARSGTYARAAVGNLKLHLKKTDVQQMDFRAGKILLENTEGVFEIRKEPTQTEELPSSGPLPHLAVDQLLLQGVEFGFHHVPDSAFFDFGVGKLLVQPQSIDLNRQKVAVERFELARSDIRIAIKQAVDNEAKPVEKPLETAAAPNGWQVSASHIMLDQNQFQYHATNMPEVKAGMDYNHLVVKNIRLDCSDLFYSPARIKGTLAHLSLHEQCGLVLRRLKAHFLYDSTHAALDNLLLETQQTRLSRNLSISYPSLATLANHIEEMGLKADLENCQVAMSDVLLFAPGLVAQPIVRKNRNRTFSLAGTLQGKVSDLIINQLQLQTGATGIALAGSLKGLPNTQILQFDFGLQELKTSRKELEAMVPAAMLPGSIRIPDALTISGKMQGTLENLQTHLFLQSSDGNAGVEATLTGLSSQPGYVVDLETKKFDAGRLLKQRPMLGKVTSALKLEGKGFDPQKMDATLNGSVHSIDLQGYTYQNIDLKAEVKKEVAHALISVADPNLKMEVNASVVLGKEPSATANLVVRSANLQALKLTSEDLKLSLNAAAEVNGFDLQTMDGTLRLAPITLLKDGRKIEVNSLVAHLENDQKEHVLDIKSDVLNLNYAGTIGLDKTADAVKNYLSRQLGNRKAKRDTADTRFGLTLEVNPHPLLSEAFVPDLKKFTGLKLDGKFAGRDSLLQLEAHIDQFQYQDNLVNQFDLKVNADEEVLQYNLGLASFRSGNMQLPKATLKGNLADKILDFDLAVTHPDTGDRLRMTGLLNHQRPTDLQIKLTGGKMVLNNEDWVVDERNLLHIYPAGINLQHFEIGQKGQFIRAQSIGEKASAPIDIRFQKFEVGTISRIIEKDTAIVRGLIDGDVHIQRLSPFAFTSNLAISDIVFQNVAVGNLTVEANNLTPSRYNAQIKLSGDSNDVRLVGYYQQDQLEFDLQIAQLRMKLVEAFASDFVRKTDGYISGKMAIKGKATQPSVEGVLTFNNASLLLVAINNQLLLKNESISVNTQGIHFKDFTVLDSAGQPLQVNGSVLTSDFSKMEFQLDVTTRNFTVLRTTEKDNPAYYGRLVLSSLIKIRGNNNLPVITANAKLLDGSTFTFVVLEGDLNTSRGEGVVVFEDSVARLRTEPKDTIQMKTEFRGIDFSANLEVNQNSAFKVIVDPESGDNLELRGDASLAFSIDQSGKVSLSGTYTLREGRYLASFQKVLKREFTMKPGSQISWSGDPMDGQIDLTAVYTTQSAATDLLASELSGMSEAERMAYRKLLTYEVNLKVEGPLLKPQLSFALDMPPEDQLAFGGMVYAKINVLNTDPNELNKQVFSLLVLNKFLPTGNSQNTSTGDAVSTLARNSVNQMLSDQLNALSGRYIKGAELNFNLQTTEDYAGGAAQQNTALQVGIKKELFNSRLAVQVGSSIDIGSSSQQQGTANSGQSLSGDVLIEYKLTEDGRYRLKAFRQNQYEGIIDGILYKTGLGVSYTRDYEHFMDLLKRPGNKEDHQYAIPKSNK